VFGRADQGLQRLLGSAPELAPEKQRQQPPPPPGRDVEVSIEPDERPAFGRLGQGRALVVVDAERKPGHPVDPAMLGVDLANVDPHGPPPPQASSRKVYGLPGADVSGRVGGDEASILPVSDLLGRGQDPPYALRRCRRPRRRTDVDDHKTAA